LGEGTYGIVYLAKDLLTETNVAVKEIKIDHCDDGIPSTAIREIAVLQELRDNPYIVNLKDIVHGKDRNRLFLVFEYFN
jgi:serine/threonine protein kinase